MNQLYVDTETDFGIKTHTMEERINYLIDELIVMKEALRQAKEGYKQLSADYESLIEHTDSNIVESLKEEIEKLKHENSVLAQRNEKLSECIGGQLAEKDVMYFENYDAAKKYLVDTFNMPPFSLESDYEIKKAFVLHGKKLVIGNES